MSTRFFLRDSVAGALLAVALAGQAGASHAEGALWQVFRPDSREARIAAGPAPASMERMMMRTESPDHVRAQIERMEARARADERLSGRANSPSANGDDRARRADRNAPDGDRGESRPASVGPGWQARERDGGR